MSRTTRPFSLTLLAAAATTAAVATAGAGRRGSSMLRSNVVPAVLGGFVVLVAGTGTAVATTGTFIHLTDATSGVPARVDDEGRLAVGDAEGPLTVDVAGRVPVSGTVSVTNRPIVTPAEMPWSGMVKVDKLAGRDFVCTNDPGSAPLPVVPEGYRVRLASVEMTVYAQHVAHASHIGAWVEHRVTDPTQSAWWWGMQGVKLSRPGIFDMFSGRAETDLILSEKPGNGEAHRAHAKACINGPTDKLVQMSAVFTGTLVPDATTLHHLN